MNIAGNSIELKGIKDMDVMLKNITFNDVEVFKQELPLILTAIPQIKMEEIYFNDCFINTILQTEGSADIRDLQISGIASEVTNQEGLFYIQSAKYFKASKITVNQLKTPTKHLMRLDEVEEVWLQDIQVKEATLQSDFIKVYQVQNIDIKNTEIDNIVQVRDLTDSFYFIDFQLYLLKNQEQVYKFKNLKIVNSELSLFIIKDFLSIPSEEENKRNYLFELETIDFLGSDFKGKNTDAFIKLPDISSDSMLFKLTDGNFQIANSQHPFMDYMSNSKLEIENFELQNFDNPLFLLRPADESVGSPTLAATMKNIVFKNGKMSEDALIYGYMNAVLKMEDFEFENIEAEGRGTVVFVDKIDLKNNFSFVKGSFTGNNGNQGGVFHATQGSKLIFEEVNFKENSGQLGGVGYLNGDGNVKISNCIFEGNIADQADIIFSINSYQDNVLKDTIFKENSIYYNSDQMQTQGQENKENSYFVFYRSNLIFEGSLFIQNCDSFARLQAQSMIKLKETKIEESQVQIFVKALQSRIEAYNLVIKNVNQKLQESYFFHASVQSFIYFDQVEVKHFHSNFLKLEQAQSFIKGLDIEDTDQKEQILPLMNFFSTQNEFHDLKMNHIILHKAEAIYFQDSTAIMFNTEATDLTLTLIRGFRSDIKIEGLKALNEHFDEWIPNVDDQKALINLQRSYLNITDAHFELFEHLSGIMATNQLTEEEKKYVIVSNSIFRNLDSNHGTAIKVKNSDLELINSHFEDNIAIYEGGALTLLCSENYNFACDYKIKDSSFKRNKAFKGGAINFDLFPPVVQNTEFEENQASSGYGHDIGSYPFRLEVVESPKVIASGYQNEGQFKIEIRDHFDNVVSEGIDGKVAAIPQGLDVSVLGIKDSFSQNGTYNFYEIYFLGEPDTQSTILFTTESINKRIYQKVMKREFKPLEFTFTFKECVTGEILSFGTCERCSKNSYSLEAAGIKCTFCPENFSCEGGNRMLIDQGYWRPSIKSIEPYDCLNSDACPQTFEVECSPGYKGVLCAECVGQTEEGYYAKASGNSCQICEDSSIIWLKIIGVFLTIVIYIAVLSGMIIISANRAHYSSVLMRILTNYFQLTLTVRSLKIEWPNRVEALLNSLSILQSIQKDMFQFSCFFKDREENPYRLTVILMILIPFFLSTMALILWKLAAYLSPKKFKRTYWRNSVLTSFVIGYLSYPMINGYVFQGFNCREIEGKYYFIEDFSIECYKGEHLTILFTSVLPAMIIWTLGFPIYTFIQLRRSFDKLDERSTIIKYGLFYIGLKDKAYWWEVVASNLRKALVIGITVSITEKRAYLQLTLVFTFLYFNHQMIKFFEPYQEPWLNQIELQSSTAAICAVLLGCLFVDEANESQTFLMEMVFWSLLFVNVTFLIRLIFMIIKINVFKIRNLIEKQNSKKEEKKFTSGFHYNRYEKTETIKKQNEEKEKRVQANINAIERLNKATSDLKFQIETIPEMLEHIDKPVLKSGRSDRELHSGRPLFSANHFGGNNITNRLQVRQHRTAAGRQRIEEARSELEVSAVNRSEIQLSEQQKDGEQIAEKREPVFRDRSRLSLSGRKIVEEEQRRKEKVRRKKKMQEDMSEVVQYKM